MVKAHEKGKTFELRTKQGFQNKIFLLLLFLEWSFHAVGYIYLHLIVSEKFNLYNDYPKREVPSGTTS